MNALYQLVWLFLCTTSSVCVVGCSRSTNQAHPAASEHHDHDHEFEDAHEPHHVTSWTDSLDETEKHCRTMKTAFANGQPNAADEAVHEIGHPLEAMQELAAQELLPEADQEQVKKLVKTLLDAVSALDERMHVGERAGKSCREVEAQIDATRTALKPLTPR